MDGRKGFERAGWKVNEGYKQIVAVNPEGKEYFICQKGESLPSLKKQGKSFGDVITDAYNAAVKQGLIEVNDAESFAAEDCSHSNKRLDNVDEQGRHTNWPYWICPDCDKDWEFDAFCNGYLPNDKICGKADCPDKGEIHSAEDVDLGVMDGFRLGLGGAMGFAAFGITLGIIGSLLKSKED